MLKLVYAKPGYLIYTIENSQYWNRVILLCGKFTITISTYIITALKIDEDGYLWFFINKGMHELKKERSPFAAQLEFYRKGYPFFMKFEGEAGIADPKKKCTT